MEEFEKFTKDCEIYHKAMKRFAVLGITDKEKVIIEMEKEIDMYRQKLRSYEVSMKMDKSIKELDKSLAEAAGGCIETRPYICEVLPDKPVGRISSMTIKPDGEMHIYFGEVNEMANESANDIKPFTEEEKEIYNKTIERFLNIGITGKNRIILEMAKEINRYQGIINIIDNTADHTRKELSDIKEGRLLIIPEGLKEYISTEIQKLMDQKKESAREMLQAGETFAVGALSAEELHVSFPIIDALPDDLRDRLASVTVDSDERISLYFLEVKNGNDKQ